MNGSGRFATTRWSVVLAAGATPSGAARDALATLCATYWFPLYAYARRRGATMEDAQDLVQGFFAELLDKGWVGDADEERGRFRGFLVTAFRRWVRRQRERDGAQKRGGGVVVLPLDVERGEATYRREPADELTPERLYERRWALAVLDTVLARLRREMAQAARGNVFDELKVFLDGGSPLPSQKVVAERLQMSVGAVRVTVHRMRRRYRDLLRAAISETVDDPGDVDDEIRHLLGSLRS